MGNTACCSGNQDIDVATVKGTELAAAESVHGVPPSANDAGIRVPRSPRGTFEIRSFGELVFKAALKKEPGQKLGMDVDFMAERKVLPVMAVTGGVTAQWNNSAAERFKIRKGDCIIEANGVAENATSLMETCKNESVINLTVVRSFCYDNLVQDLECLVRSKECGPILVRLSWHDAGVFGSGNLRGGCPNAAMRFRDSGEGVFPANVGLPTVALALLSPITSKYVPLLIGHADLWALAANIAIRVLGGPAIPTRFGREDAKTASEGVASQVGRLPDAEKGAEHLRDVFKSKGFDDKAIVALSGAHTIGKCHLDRLGFDGPWTENPTTFDNSYFKNLLQKSYTPETSSRGCPQNRHAASGTIMLNSDLALIQDAQFKVHVERYAEDQAAFFADFAEAWVKLQELGSPKLRDVL